MCGTQPAYLYNALYVISNLSLCVLFALYSHEDIIFSLCSFEQVNAEHRREGLLVTGVGEDGVLDFGDCYANNGTCQMLTVRNITQEVRKRSFYPLVYFKLCAFAKLITRPDANIFAPSAGPCGQFGNRPLSWR